MRPVFSDDTSDWPEVWSSVYKILEDDKKLSSHQLNTWVRELQYLGSSPDSDGVTLVHLAAQSDFHVKWVSNGNFTASITSAFSQVLGTPCRLNITLNTKPKSDLAEVLETLPGDPKKAAFSSDNTSYAKSQTNPGLDPRFVFENFVVGASNQFAYASAVAVADDPGNQYNPLFIYSPPGLGKTHLLHAIGNRFRERNPGGRVVYISAESFMNELIESIQHKRMSEFRAKYRNSYDMMLIDDIQFIAGKDKTEEEFFHTFNTLYGLKRQIVLTSDRPPKEIDRLEERVRTRFEWGLVSDIQPPEIETRIAILKSKAERDDIYLPEDVSTFLATHIRSNVRVLEGILIKLQAHASLSGAEISLEMAKNLLKLTIPEESSQLTVEGIQSVVAKRFHIKLQDLKSSSRAKTVAIPRQVAMYLTRKYTGLGLKEIGQYYGGKDHTTILHAIRKIERLNDSDAEIRTLVEDIQNQL